MTFDLQFEIATSWTETLDQITPGMQDLQKLNSALQVQNIANGYL